jgi:hypothetical protein
VGTQWGTVGKTYGSLLKNTCEVLANREHHWEHWLVEMGGGGRGLVAKQNLQVPHSSPLPEGGEFLTIH